MEQTVDETLLSHEKQIDHRKTCINGSTSSDSHIREDQSESSDSRRRAGWSSFQSDRFIQDKRVCRDFLRGKCVRGISCKFAHSEPAAQEGYKTYVCNDFLVGRCDRVSCKYLHPESDRTNGCGSTGNVNLGTAANFGKSQFYGENRYHDPRSSSFPRRNRSRSPCRRFQDGTCYRGESCSYLHSEYGAFNRSRNDYNTPLQQGAATTSRYRDFGEAHKGNTLRTSQEHTYMRSRNDVTPPWHRAPVTTSGNPNFGRVDINEGNAQSTGSFYAGQRNRSHCRDFIRGMCNRGAHCPYLHTNAGPRDDCVTQKQQFVETSENPGFPEGSVHVTRSFSGGYRSKSPCHDYLRGRCSRGARCPYLHLDNDTYVKPKDACSTQQVHEVAATSENPGSGEGREGIILRAPQEHEDANMDEDLSSSDFPRQPRRRSPCRNFLSGRCFRGASCYYLHLETHGYYSENTTPRSRSPDRQQSRHLGSLGVDKTRPEVCLKYSRGRCTLGESCRYLHSFHEYAKSASDCTKPQHSGGMHQHDPSMMQEERDGSFHEKTRGKNADNVENPNTTDAKDEAGVGDQQKCEVSEVDEKNNLFRRSFKRRRSSSRSPSTPRDNIDGRKTRRDESQDNFHWRRNRSGSSPLTPGDDSGCRKIRKDESYNDFPRGRCHNVAPFRYPYSHSYRYNVPRHYINKEPQSSSHGISEDPNVLETQGRDEAVSHEMQLDQCPDTGLDSSTQIVSVKDSVQPSIVDQGGVEKPVISKGEKAVGSLVALDTTSLCGENRSSPMDPNTCTLNKGDNAEVETDLSRDGSEKTDSKKQALNSLSQPDTSGARVSDNAQNVVTISHPALQLGQGNEVVTKEIQNNVSVDGTTNDGSSAGYLETNSMQTSQSLVKSTISSARRKLLVLDVNGLLADIVNIGEVPRGYKPDTIIAMKAVFKRPHCDDFLEFCFDRFDVGIWSSRNKKNVDRVLDFLIFNTKKRLLFCWDQAHCTETGYKTIENRDKPLVLKELKKLWEKQVTDLPWEKGFYDETNTVLLDDSPYKALCNPPYTAIFPYAYKFRDTRDRSLGRRGDLRVYLEKLAATDNIQKFIEENPFGQRAITKSNLSWGFYSKIIRANQQEGSSNNSPAMKAAVSHATDSAADHTQQPEGNADKAPASKDLGAHLVREEGNVDNTLVNQQGIAHITTDIKVVARENQQEGNADNSSDTKVVACETQLEENFHNTTDIKVVANENRQEEKADNSVDTNFVAHETQQEANADNNPDTKVVDLGTQLAENFDNTTDIKVVASENRQGEQADNSVDTNFVAHETQQQANADNNPGTQLAENFDNTTVKVVASEIQQEENADKLADTNFVAHETQQQANAISTHVN